MPVYKAGTVPRQVVRRCAGLRRDCQRRV